MSETKTVWRECADPEELAAAVAAGVKVQYEHDGRWHRNYFVTADDFAAYGLRYRVPASWSEWVEVRAPRAVPVPEQPRNRVARVLCQITDDQHRSGSHPGPCPGCLATADRVLDALDGDR